jgi:hypothetical protein
MGIGGRMSGDHIRDILRRADWDGEPLASSAVDVRPARRHRCTCRECGQSMPKKRARRDKTIDAKYRGLLAQLDKFSEWSHDHGPDALGYAWLLHQAQHRVIDKMVGICLREWSSSWAEIGERTNMTKQAAQQRWGQLGAARRPGGQQIR